MKESVRNNEMIVKEIKFKRLTLFSKIQEKIKKCNYQIDEHNMGWLKSSLLIHSFTLSFLKNRDESTRSILGNSYSS